MGLRESKKQKTRASISLLATRLFIERGYDNVTTAEIAKLAEVSVPTLFKYFPSKESLVFDEDSEREKTLIETVKERKKGQSILAALTEMGLEQLAEIQTFHSRESKAFMRLLRDTPQLGQYAQKMWLRHERSLAVTLQKEAKHKTSQIEAEAIARYVLTSLHRSIEEPNPERSFKSMMALIERGWRG